MHVWEAVNLRKKIVFQLSPLFLQQSFCRFLLSQIIHYQVKLWGGKKRTLHSFQLLPWKRYCFLLELQMSYHIVHLRTIIHPKAGKRNAPRTILNLFEEKYWKLTTVAAAIRDGGAEVKLIPGCPAGPGLQTHHNGYDKQPDNELASKLQFLPCNYSEAFDQRCIVF